MDTSGLYSGEYVNSTYIDEEGLRRNFERIMSLDPEKSDNVGRVVRILAYAHQHFGESGRSNGTPSVLDVGSGLCVFLCRMKAAGWACTALDPDPRAVAHAERTVGVKAVCGDFLKLDQIGKFDLVAFNKVLEHIKDPMAMLTKAIKHLSSRGFVYVEVPDGDVAVTKGQDREEFFIDHWHIFSDASLALLATRAGFVVRELQRLCEPSGKYTLRAFLVPA